MRLQTVVAREVAADRSAVVTVASLHAGTRENVIPDTADLTINIRSTTPTVRTHLLDAVERIVRAEAAASAVPKEPEITVINGFPVTVNDAEATAAVQAAFRTALGRGRVVDLPQPLTGSEDFGAFGTALGAPSVYWTFGGLGPDAFAGVDLLGDGIPPEIPHNHSPLFAPVPEPTIELGVRYLLLAALPWLGPDEK
jgi:hippurate hydrolase